MLGAGWWRQYPYTVSGIIRMAKIAVQQTSQDMATVCRLAAAVPCTDRQHATAYYCLSARQPTLCLCMGVPHEVHLWKSLEVGLTAFTALGVYAL